MTYIIPAIYHVAYKETEHTAYTSFAEYVRKGRCACTCIRNIQKTNTQYAAQCTSHEGAALVYKRCMHSGNMACYDCSYRHPMHAYPAGTQYGYGDWTGLVRYSSHKARKREYYKKIQEKESEMKEMKASFQIKEDSMHKTINAQKRTIQQQELKIREVTKNIEPNMVKNAQKMCEEECSKIKKIEMALDADDDDTGTTSKKYDELKKHILLGVFYNIMLEVMGGEGDFSNVMYLDKCERELKDKTTKEDYNSFHSKFVHLSEIPVQYILNPSGES